MGPQKQASKALNITLWIAQILLSASMLWASAMKLFQPVEKLAAMWPWAGQVSPILVKFTGIVDLLGALGLILPALIHKPKLISFTAMAIIVLMICASIFHIARGEASVIGVNVVFAGLAVFIAWGRFTKAN